MGVALKQRFWEIDLFRGIAIVMMVLFHFFFDLDYLGIMELDMHSGLLLILGRTAAIIFVFLVGVSLTLSHSREQLSGRPAGYYKFFKRGVGIFSWGLVITLVTALLLERGTIYFGILHLIGVSIIISYPFLKYRIKPLITGLAILIMFLPARQIFIESPLLLWFGIMPYGFYTLDYFPLIPWFGVVLLGIFTGNSLYTDYQRQFVIFDLSGNPAVRILGYLGRRSLFIYLVHQLVIVGLLILVYGIL